MKIKSIFENVLYAVQYENEETHEFERLFDIWQDISFLEKFFEDNRADLQSGFFGKVTIEDAVLATRKEAKELSREFLRLAKLSGTSDQHTGIESLFRPLDNNEYRIRGLTKSKARGKNARRWLRIYAIRIDVNVYVVTGGAIKLTLKMNERDHTEQELKKIDKCRAFLLEQGLTDIESFVDLEI